MKKNRINPLWIIVGIMLLIVVVAAIIYFFTGNDSVKNYGDSYKEKADALRLRIEEKESLVNWLKEQLECAKQINGFVLCKANRIFMAVKITAVIFLIGGCVIIHSVFNMNFWELFFGVFSTLGIAFNIIYIVVKNEFGNLNDFLRMMKQLFIEQGYRINNFEPVVIEVIEERLRFEMIALEELKRQQRNLMS